MCVVLMPAYGRDYKTAEQATKDYLAGKDFIFIEPSYESYGKYASCRNYRGQIVEIRYNKLTNLTLVRTPEE